MHPDVPHNVSTGDSVIQPVQESSSGTPVLEGAGSADTDSRQGASSFSEHSGVDIKDPVELLYLLDEMIASGITKLHKWQVQFMIDFADSQHTKDFPFLAEVRACNGSGKDKYVVAACVVWLALKYKYSRAVVTNGSGVQLDNQTEAYIEQLCNQANLKFGGNIFRCNYRYYECVLTSSPIVLFATDEPNKAEGFHPLIPGGRMAIFASEAKAIPDEIFEALNRCTGYTHRVDVSTPGLPMGKFYTRCSGAIARKSVASVKAITPGDALEYHITAFDCSHITKVEIEQFARDLPGGINSPIYKSGILAEFGTTDEMVVIPYTYIWKACTPETQPSWLVAAHNTAGLDLSDGGDETVLTVRNGNKLLKIIPFRFDNTEDTVKFLEEKFKENGLNHPESLIYADCGGIGKPILDRLKGMGWKNIRYVDNRHTPYYPKTYLNRGSEVWFHTRLLFERNEIICLNDKVLKEQLSTRYYKIDVKGRHQLLSKIESRSRGYPSPDRADSFVLAFWDYKSTKAHSPLMSLPEAEQTKRRPFAVPAQPKPQGTFTMQSSVKKNSETLSSFRKGLRKQRDFSLLQEEVDNWNKQRMLEKTI